MSLFSLLPSKNKAEGLTGISFHPDGISYAHVKKDKAGQVLLDTCEFAPLEENEGYESLLHRLIKEHHAKKSQFVCVMPPDSYSLFQVEAPDVPPDELRAAVRWGIKDIIDFHIDDAVIDVFDIPEQIGQEGSNMMYVVAARANEIQQQVNILHEAGLTIQAIDINELALRNIVLEMKQGVDGIVLISLSRTSGEISLLHKGNLYLSRSIQIGSDQLREAYDADSANTSNTNTPAPGASLTDLLDRQVEMGPDELRRAYDMDSTGAPSAGPALKNLLDNIALELQYSMDYYESHYSAPPMQNIVVAPMEQEIPGMAEYLSSEFRLPLEFMNLCEFLDCPDIIPPDVQARCSAAVGVALRQEG